MMTTNALGIAFAILGLALGFGVSYLIRRRRAATEATRRVSTPVVYANRQQARKAARERQKT